MSRQNLKAKDHRIALTQNGCMLFHVGLSKPWNKKKKGIYKQMGTLQTQRNNK